jgi:precorrin-4/cobalt-precorrin-4 C11-methyltransferase
MKAFFVGAGPGNPELLTCKARRLLENCKICVYAGSLISPEVIGIIAPSAEKHDSAGMDLDQIKGIFQSAQRRNIDVVRLHTGDPSIFGAIGEQMALLRVLGIPYEVIPGVSSFQAAAAVLCVELTAPEISQTIILTRTSGRTPVPGTQRLDALAKTQATLCIFLSVHNLAAISKTLSGHYGGDCPAAVVCRASWPNEQVVRGTLDDIAEKAADVPMDKTAMILVGRALGTVDTVSKLYDAAFTHGYRKGRK